MVPDKFSEPQPVYLVPGPGELAKPAAGVLLVFAGLVVVTLWCAGLIEFTGALAALGKASS